MSNLFYRGQFNSYKVNNINKSLESITESYTFDSSHHKIKTKVFNDETISILNYMMLDTVNNGTAKKLKTCKLQDKPVCFY